MEVRIVKRTTPAGDTLFVIQKKTLFSGLWTDVWISGYVSDTGDNEKGLLEEAKNNLWRFDGTANKDEVVVP